MLQFSTSEAGASNRVYRGCSWFTNGEDCLAAFCGRLTPSLRSYDLGPAPGVLHGLTYPLARDLDGTHSPMSVFLRLNWEGLDGDARANWMRVLGVQATVMEEMPLTRNLSLACEQERFGGVSRLFLVREPAPMAVWPRSVTTAVNPPDAFRIVSLSPDPVMDVAAYTGFVPAAN